jgi:hypothetical protein
VEKNTSALPFPKKLRSKNKKLRPCFTELRVSSRLLKKLNRQGAKVHLKGIFQNIFESFLGVSASWRFKNYFRGGFSTTR